MGQSTHYCPCCGFNIQADPVITVGPWILYPSETWLDGQRLDVTSQQAAILHTVAAAKGRRVTSEFIRGRVSDSENTRTIATSVCRLRQRLGSRMPIESVGRGRQSGGYRWNPHAYGTVSQALFWLGGDCEIAV